MWCYEIPQKLFTGLNTAPKYNRVGNTHRELVYQQGKAGTNKVWSKALNKGISHLALLRVKANSVEVSVMEMEQKPLVITNNCYEGVLYAMKVARTVLTRGKDGNIRNSSLTYWNYSVRMKCFQ